MNEFFIGYFVGASVFITIFVILAYFKYPIEKEVKAVERKIAQAGPRQKGFIIEPEDDADDARRNIITANAARGKNTKLSDLQ
jgi:hypothetical protein